MKAAIYSRFSTDRQTDSSIADQVRVCSEYAQREGMQVTELFEDQGISGAAIGNRPSVIRMREAALARRFDVLLVMDLSRLSRSQADLPKLIDQLAAKGVRTIGVQDGYDSARKGHKLQAGLHGILGEAFREMVKDRTYAALESRAKDRRPTGGRAYGYIAASQSATGVVSINDREAEIVREIFQRFAEGETCFAIAKSLNARGVPSPGSTWNRTQRRAAGWMRSAIRSMLKNPLYKGQVIWNTSEWVKDPDTGKRTRVARPASEWIQHSNAELRIVTAALWARAQARTRDQNDERLKAGGKPRYLLSGLLRCDVCGSHYIIADSKSYSCSGYLNGRACSNSTRVRRAQAEAVLLEGLRGGLLAPDRIEKLVGQIRAAAAEQERKNAVNVTSAPKELTDLDARIARLRERMRRGDPDMTADELQHTIELAEAKRSEIIERQPAAKHAANVERLLPQAAKLAREWLEAAMRGSAPVSPRARPMLRDLFGGQIRLAPGAEPGSLWAAYQLHPGVLLRGTGTYGSGGRI